MKNLFAALLLLIIPLHLLAQQGETFSVVGFTEKPFDTAAKDERYKIIDGNGDLFSIIKLVSSNAGDDLRAYSFDFGLCESRIKEVDGEVWVYVQRNAMRAKIRREGYKTVTCELPLTVQPGRVYEMVISATPRVVKKRYLLFRVQPSDSKALVLIKAEGEKEYGPFSAGQVNEEGMLSDKLVLGKYYYKITSQNYHQSEGVIELTEGQGTFTEEVTLRPNFGTLTLTAEEGAEIFVDGESKGFGSWTGVFRPGLYNVECRKANHRNAVETVEVKEGEELAMNLKSPQPITGALDMTSEPLQATITVDGKECGKTPAVIDGLIIGKHNVTVSKNGYSTVTLDVEIKDGETTEQSVTLERHVKKQPETIKEQSQKTKPEKEKNQPKEVKEKPRSESGKKEKSATEKQPQTARKNTSRRERGCGYVELAGILGQPMGVGLNAGGYISRFNIEAYGNYGLSSKTLYSNDGAAHKVAPFAYGARLGYAFAAGNSFAFTPQLGVGGLTVYGEGVRALATTVSLGVRCELFFTKNIGMSIAPEYVYGIKSDTMKQLASTAPSVGKWCSGFSARVGLYFNF